MRIAYTGLTEDNGPAIIPEGLTTLRILKAGEHTSQAGNKSFQVILQACDPDYALCDNIFDYIPYVKDEDAMLPSDQLAKVKRSNRFAKTKLTSLLTAAGVDFDDTGFETEDLLGKEVVVQIQHESNDRGMSAKIARYVPN